MATAVAEVRNQDRRSDRLPAGPPALLMGILNATPDSFSDGGRHLDPGAAVAAGLAMAAAGAAWLDVGGESTRPGAAAVDAAEEIRRVVPVVAGLRRAGVAAGISIDTSKAAVAAAALDAGAELVNDVSAGDDPAMLPLIAARGAACCLMHRQGLPPTMQARPDYRDVVDEVGSHLAARLAAALAAGVPAHRVLLDPGIGFGKTVAHNLALLRALPALATRLGRPLLVGVSRKSLLAALADASCPADRRDGPSHILHALLASRCAMLRVHDVAGAAAALRLAAAVAP
ncbi:MAG: dihydropteroate synthase [Planctomycetes bacterium]|nr:dihydropteroate synthase [Planctomycetota bacterium]